MTSWAAEQFDFWGAEEQGTKDLRTRCWLGYLSSSFSVCSILSCSLYFSFRKFARGWRVLVFIPGAFVGDPPICVYSRCNVLILGGRCGTTIQLLVTAIVRRIL